MKRKILIIVLCFACMCSYAQTKKRGSKKRTRKVATTQKKTKDASTTFSTQSPIVDTAKKVVKPAFQPVDGYYSKINISSAKMTPYPSIREADIIYSKRIWRDIDVREKMNQYLVAPKARLIDIIMDALDSGELTAYDPTPNEKNRLDPDGDAFGTALKQGGARGRLAGDSTPVNTIDKDGNIIGTKMVASELNPDSVVKFRIKEDWIFDKQRSVFEPRIIGIAPLVKMKALAAMGLGDYQPAFWIYFPDLRPILAVKEVLSSKSDATGLSFDDAFMKRIFTSYIIKESNEKNEKIKDYAIGVDRLYESDRIKKGLMDWELNLWQY